MYAGIGTHTCLEGNVECQLLGWGLGGLTYSKNKPGC